MRIRSFVSADVTALARLYCRCFAEAPWYEKHLAAIIESELLTYAAWPDTIFLVAEDQQKILGAIIGFDLSRKSGVQATVPVDQQIAAYYLAELFVHSNWRKRGIGTQLITQLLSELAGGHYRYCVLRTSTTARLLNLYARHGFRVVAKQTVLSTKLVDGQEISQTDERRIMLVDITQ